ncbi:MAG: serine hydrolase [Candidatus Saccharimonadales bacterium]
MLINLTAKARWWAIALTALTVVLALVLGPNPVTPAQPTAKQPGAEVKQPAKEAPLQFSKAKLEAAVDGWVSVHSGTYGVTLMDKQGRTLATAGAEESFFAASIYKLYVAYIGYQKVDDKTYSLDEPYLGGYSRGKCLDTMIRESHSPCAEKMWAELGREQLTKQLKTYGLKNTDMNNLSTTSYDAAVILARIERGEGLSNVSRKAYLDSLAGQIYRSALPVGFTNAKVYNKVGFNGYVEYHDTAIVRLGDGRSLIVSVLTRNVGTKNIAGLARAIQATL